MAGEEEGETLHGSSQRAADIQNLHEAAAALTQVKSDSVLSMLGFLVASIQSDAKAALEPMFCHSFTFLRWSGT